MFLFLSEPELASKMFTQIMKTGAKITDSYVGRRLNGMFDRNGFSQCPPCLGADKFPDNRGPCGLCGWVVPGNLPGNKFKLVTQNDHGQFVNPVTHMVLENKTYFHGDRLKACEKFQKEYFSNVNPTKKSWWSFFTNKPLITVIVVLILVILLMAGVLIPMLKFMRSILEGLWASFLDLLRGMLCPCGPKWNRDDWVPAELAEGYLSEIASLKTELERARFQQNQTPGPEFKNTPETTPTSLVDWKGYFQVAMNLATAVGGGFYVYHAVMSSGVNAMAGVPQMDLPGQAAQMRAQAK